MQWRQKKASEKNIGLDAKKLILPKTNNIWRKPFKHSNILKKLVVEVQLCQNLKASLTSHWLVANANRGVVARDFPTSRKWAITVKLPTTN